MSATDVVLILATTTVGITAGVMFCYWIGVMPGLHGLDDREFIQAFQLIDRKIVNPLFVLVSFLGGGALLLAGTGLEGPGSEHFGLLVAATAVYVVGVVAVTLAGHVPRNAALDRFPVGTASAQEAADARRLFEGPWNHLHALRTIAAVASLILLVTAVAD
jgi:uncharacterized membrane protein